MACDVGESFLCDAEDLFFDAGIEGTIDATDLHLLTDLLAGGALSGAGDTGRQAILGDAGAQLPDALASIVETFLNESAGLSQLLADGGGVV